MSVKIEKTKKENEVKLVFTIKAERFEEAIAEVFKANAKHFSLPGFRKGKVPYNMIEKTYGPEVFYEDAFEKLWRDEYQLGVIENKIDVVTSPELDIVQIEKGKDLIFTAIVETKPEVKLGKYKKVEVKLPSYKITAKEVTEELEKMAEKNARIVSANDKPVESGSITIIDFEGFKDGVAFDGGKAEGYELTIGSNSFIPGFEDQIIGMKKDEEKDIEVTFPKDYPQPDLSNAKVVFKIKLHEIKKKELPKIDDELAKDISEFETLEELKKDIKDKKTKEAKQRETSETESLVIAEVVKNAKIEISDKMIDLETEHMIQNMEQRLSYQGMEIEQYLKMMNKTLEEFKEESKPYAKEQIAERLVLEAIAAKENIKVTDKEILAKVKELSEQHGQDPKEMEKNESFKQYVENILTTEEVIKLLVDNIVKK